MADLEDGKVRVRCSGCGKRVKFPANMPGTTFRCPKCHTTLVTPLDLGDLDQEAPQGMSEVTKVRAATGFRDVPGTVTESVHDAATPAAASAAKPQPPAGVERFHAFWLKESERIAKLCAHVVLDRTIPPKQKRMELTALRQERAVSLARFADSLLADLEKAVQELKDSPAADTPTGKQRIADMEVERDGLKIYLDVTFQRRTVAEDVRRSAAKPGTPETGEAPPRTPSPSTPQTPPG